MNDVVNVIRRAAARLFFNRLIGSLPVFAAIALAGLLTLRLLERLVGLPVDWALAWWIAGGASALAAVIWSSASARDRAAVARLLDERAELRETLSTAVALGEPRDAWSAAAIEQARLHARELKIRRVVPLRFPRQWPASALAAIAFVVVWFAVPQADLFGRDREREEEAAQAQEIAEAQAEAETIEDELREMLAKLGEENALESSEAELETRTPSTPDDIRRAAIRKLTSVQDRLESMRSSQQSRMLDEIKNQMRRLRQPGLGPANQVVSALQRGDFDRAAEQLSELMQDIAQGELSEEKKRELVEQLANLAEQLEKLAQERRGLENQLRQAGLDPSLSNNPGALQEAIQNAQGLSDEQKQQLMEQAQAAQNANNQLGRMAQALQQAAAQMGNQNGMEGLLELGDQLNELEMIAQEMRNVEAAQNFAWGKIADLSQCMGGGRQEMSPFQLWRDQSLSNSAGSQPGESLIDAEDVEANPTKSKAIGQVTQGPIIGSMVVEGEQVRGESRAQFAELVEAGGQAAADAIETKITPREYHDALKHYFGRLKAKAEAETAPDESSHSTPSPSEPE